MLEAVETQDKVLEREKGLKALEKVYLTRFTDDKMAKLVRQNKGGTFHLAVSGHELVGVVSAMALQPGKDWGFPYYRDRAFCIGLGCSLTHLLGAFLARDVPCHSGGRMMPEHFSQKDLRLPCQSSCVGSQFLQAVGLAKGLRLQGKDEIVYVSAGDGATSQGDFHEALNFACLYQLNIIFMIQDNGWAISVPLSEQTAGESISEIGRGYAGLSVFDVDGCDYEDLTFALDAAVKKGRQGGGPSLIVTKVPRLAAHSNSDDPTKYKRAEIIHEEKMRDPLPLFEEYALKKEWLTEAEIKVLKEKCFRDVEDAATLAEEFPFPDPESVLDHVFKEENQEQIDSDDALKAESIVMVDALNHALIEEMQSDKGVVVFGEDVAHGKGGVFGVTRHLTAKYGVSRCFNTPLAESTIIALALGMSLDGYHKPVAEIQFADYFWPGVNQLFNEVASFHYRSNGEWTVPLVIRMPYGGYIQGGPYHSQSVEAFLAHCPGLKVVIPSNAADAKRLLKAAIRDPNPVIFLEHKALYRQRVFCARPEPSIDALLPLGKAEVIREGSDVTFVGWGMMIVMAVEIAEKLSKEGISVEIIDVRTIVPFDFETILTSLKKTSKILIAHEAPLNCGFGAEIAARIADEGFNYLDAPVKRIGGLNCCVPYCKLLEDRVLPQPPDLERELRNLSQF